jgi:hypothetical protein
VEFGQLARTGACVHQQGARYQLPRQLLREAREPRYKLLESPRLLAIEQLRAAGEQEPLRRRHATALAVAFDAEWDQRWSGHLGARQWASRILPDASNARDAIRWARAAGESATAVTIAATLFKALPRWSSHAERMGLADVCESLAERVASPLLQLRAWVVTVQPMLHRQQQQSLTVAGKAVALARELDRQASDRWPLYQALSLWIGAAAVVSHPAADALREALAELAALEDPGWPAQRLLEPAIKTMAGPTWDEFPEGLRADLENENATIRSYRERVKQCEALGEYAIAEDIREILRQEQEHQVDLATALGEDVPDLSKPATKSSNKGNRAH